MPPCVCQSPITPSIALPESPDSFVSVDNCRAEDLPPMEMCRYTERARSGAVLLTSARAARASSRTTTTGRARSGMRCTPATVSSGTVSSCWHHAIRRRPLVRNHTSLFPPPAAAGSPVCCDALCVSLGSEIETQCTASPSSSHASLTSKRSLNIVLMPLQCWAGGGLLGDHRAVPQRHARHLQGSHNSFANATATNMEC